MIRIWKRMFPPQSPAFYAQVWLFLSNLLFKTVKKFSIKSGAVRKEHPLSYTEQFLFVLSFNVAPYFQFKKNFFLFDSWPFLKLCMFWFWLPAHEYLDRNLHIFLAKWFFLSFDRTILREKEWERGLSCPSIVWLLKKTTRTFNFLRKFLLIKNIRNFRINCRNELQYSYIFIMYMRGFAPSLIPHSLD